MKTYQERRKMKEVKIKKTLAEIYDQLESEWMKKFGRTFVEERDFLREAAFKIYLGQK